MTMTLPPGTDASALEGCCAKPHGEIVERQASGFDPEIRTRNLKRLRRIEGQVRGLQRMVEEDRYCADVLTQIASVHEALRSLGRELVRHHLKHCTTSAIRTRDVEAEVLFDELIDLMYRHAR